MGGDSGSGTQKQTVIQDLPEWSKPYWKGIAATGKRLAAKPFEQYRGSRVSRFDPMEEQAFRGVQDVYDAGPRRELLSAEGIASEAARRGFKTPQWGSSAYQQYANPFLEGVMDLGRDRLSEGYNEALSSGLAGSRDQGISSGIVGGRSSLRDARVAGKISDEAFRNMREYEADMRMASFDKAQDAFFKQSEQERLGTQMAMDAGTQLQNIAKTQQDQAFQRIEALRNAGLSQRELDQRIKDIAYEDFLARRDYQQQQLNWFTSLLSGTPYNITDSTQISSSRGGGPSTGQTLGGLGIAALGAYGASQG